jgi:hypothetical protein
VINHSFKQDRERHLARSISVIKLDFLNSRLFRNQTALCAAHFFVTRLHSALRTFFFCHINHDATTRLAVAPGLNTSLKRGPAARTHMNSSHGHCDAHNMCNGFVGETSELMQKRGEQMSQEYRFVTKMIFGLSTTIS